MSAEDKRRRAEAQRLKARELRVQRVKRWRRLEVFEQNEFYEMDIKPMLDRHRLELGAGGLWKPGCSGDVGTVAMGAAFNGGRLYQVEHFELEADRIRRDGMVALAELKKEGIEL